MPEPSKDVGEASTPHAQSFLCPDWLAAFSRAPGSTGRGWPALQAPAQPAQKTRTPPHFPSPVARRTRDNYGNTYFVVAQSLSHVRQFATPWTAARQPSLSFTISESLLRLMSIESVMSSNHLILCHPLLLLPSNFPSIRVFSNK